MELRDIRIRNFRTVGQEQGLPLGRGMTLVGPNSSGKTNILRAIQILFTGFDNTFSYSRSHDLTFGEHRNRTSIVAAFTGDPDGADKEIFDLVDELHKLQGTSRSSNEFGLTLYFTETDTPVYNVFPNVKRPTDKSKNAQYSRIHKQLTTLLIESFCIYYVPSAKSIPQLYEELLAPFLRRLAAKALQPHVESVLTDLGMVASRLNSQLHAAGLSNLSASFTFPGNSLERLFTNFDFVLEDPAKTPLYEKGMGIQATALLASFLWVTQEQKANGKSVIWLLEEPESYLHPQLSTSCLRILTELEKESLVVKTTHALNFVPQDPEKVRGVFINSSRTEISSFKTFAEATTRLREYLGIRFSDFYNLDAYNVLVEGPTDREVLKWLLTRAPAEKYAWPLLRKAQILDQGGVKHLTGFLRATFLFIRKERACVAMLDGDEAGTKERKELQHYFGNIHVPFASNLDFVVVRDRFAIEGLFPDSWIIDLHVEHENWFRSFSIDASGQLLPFDIHDNHKPQALSELRKRADGEADLNWATRFIGLCHALEDALDKQVKRLQVEKHG